MPNGRMLGIAVIGCGGWGRNHVRIFAKLGVLVAVCDASQDSLQQARQIAPGVQIYVSIDQVLSDSRVNAVIIATPAETHGDLAHKALMAGRDVFLEKPMTLTSEKAEDLVRIAQNTGCILMVGHLLLYTSLIRRAKEEIDAGRLGRIQQVAVRRAKQGKVRQYENVMWSFGCHDIAAAIYLIGEEKIQRIQAAGHTFLQQGIEDDTHLFIGFESGTSAVIHSSWYWPENERTYTILGDKAWIRIDEVADTIRLYDKGFKKDFQSWDGGSVLLTHDAEEPLMTECRHFLDCVMHRLNPLSDGRSGIAVVKTLERATKIMRNSGNPGL